MRISIKYIISFLWITFAVSQINADENLSFSPDNRNAISNNSYLDSIALTFSKPKHKTRIHNYWNARKGFDTVNVQKIISDYKNQQHNKDISFLTQSDYSWEELGPKRFNPHPTPLLSNGRVDRMLIDPSDPDTWYVLSGSGGLWITYDNGDTWNERILSDGLVIGQNAIRVNPSNPNHIVVITGDSDGVVLSGGFTEGIYQSFDKGITWDKAIDTFRVQDNIIISDFEFSRNGDSIITVGSNGLNLFILDQQTEIYEYSKKIIYSGESADDFKQITYVPENDTYYATSLGYTGPAALLASSGGLDNFKVIKEYPESRRIVLYWSPADFEYLYLLASGAQDENFHFLSKMKLDTEDVTEIDVPIGKNIIKGQTAYNLSLMVSHQDKDNIYIGGVMAAGTNDGGVTWDTIARNVHVDHHQFYFDDARGRFFSCNDGGIYSTVEGNENWTNHSDGLNITQFYRVEQSHQHPDYLIGSSQDNGTIMSFDGTVRHIVGRDGFDAIISDSIPDHISILTQTGVLGDSEDGGKTVDLYRAKNRIYYPFRGNIKAIPNSDRYYYGAAELLEFDFGDSLGTVLTDFGNIRMINAFSFNPTDPNIIAVAKHDTLYITEDKFESYQQFVLPQTEVMDIEFSTTGDSLYISFGLYNTTNRIAVFHNGEFDDAIGEGLPQLPINAMELLGRPYPIVCVSDMAVHIKESGSQPWTIISKDIPTSVFTDIEYSPIHGNLTVSTFGRGLWRTQFTNRDNLRSEFSFDSLSTCWDTLPNIDLTADLNETIDLKSNIIWNDGNKELDRDFEKPGDYWAVSIQEDSDLVYSNKISVDIRDEPKFFIGIANNRNGDNTLCEGDSLIAFIYSPEKPGWENDTYWNNGEVNSFISIKEQGYYSAYSNDLSGCIGFSDTVYISVLKPETRRVRTNNNLLIAPDGALSYSWFRNGIPLNSSDQYIELDISGTYQSVFTTEDGCSFSTESFEYTEPVLEPNVYMNWEVGIVYENLPESSQLVVYDLLGNEVTNISDISGTGSIDRSTMAQGVYFVTIRSESFNKTYKLQIGTSR
jgi:hypothetical protein